MANPTIITPQKKNPQLEKAKLVAYNGEATDIVLMFNPTDITFSRKVDWESKPGNRSTTLLPKINFSGLQPYMFTLKQLLFDTYETKESVMDYIKIIQEGVETIASKRDKRPPVYTFRWRTNYYYCVMTNLSYTLNMFLTDGTPVRALVDISLQQVDEPNSPGGNLSTPKGPNRPKDNRI